MTAPNSNAPTPALLEQQGTVGIATPIQPLVALGVGGVLIGGASVAPAIGMGFGQWAEMGVTLVGLASMGVGAYGIYRAYISEAEENQGLSQSLRKARVANQRSANWLRRINESTDFYWESDPRNLVRCLDGVGAKDAGIFKTMGVGVSIYEWPASNMDKAAWESLRKQMRDEEAIWNLELQLRDEKGRDMWVALSGRPLYGTGRSFDGYSGIGRDITAQKVAERRVLDGEVTDRLTKLPNRQMLLSRLPTALASARRRAKPLAVLMVAIAGLEPINLEHGLLVGDQVLQLVAQRLKLGVRETDLVARLEGDRFVVMLEDVGTGEDDARQNTLAIADKLEAYLQQPYPVAGLGEVGIPCQVRMGYAVARTGQDSADSILARARVELTSGNRAPLASAEPVDGGVQ